MRWHLKYVFLDFHCRWYEKEVLDLLIVQYDKIGSAKCVEVKSFAMIWHFKCVFLDFYLGCMDKNDFTAFLICSLYNIIK